MDIRALQYFLAVAREGSITRAAESLHMTQPPLSRHLRELEEELGKKLFIRGKRITLTEEGMLLRRRAEELVDLLEKTKAELTVDREGLGGDVYIGCGETKAVRFLSRTARALGEKHPQIRYHIYSGSDLLLCEKLEKGLVDFALLVEGDRAGYESLALPVKDTWGVLMRRDAALAEKQAISPQELAGRPLIVSHQDDPEKEPYAWLKREVPSLHIAATYDLLYNAVQFALQGFGYVLAQDGILPDTEGAGLCFRPFSPPMETTPYIVWKKYPVQSPAASAFLSQLRKELGDS